MKFQTERPEKDKISVKLEGSLNRLSVPQIRKGLLKAAGQKGIKSMEIDLSRVSNMDTAGIALMVEVLRVLADNGGKLRLNGLNENAVKMIRLSRLDSVFDIEDHFNGGVKGWPTQI